MFTQLLPFLFVLVAAEGQEARNLNARYAYEIYFEVQETVRIDLLYESLCPDSIQYYETIFVPGVNKLAKYLDVHTYPYGNAKMNSSTGHIKCQHGELECYGNKLHACSIDILKKTTDYVVFIGCVIGKRSNDSAIDECAESLNVSSHVVKAIKKCAKGRKGQELLEYYGRESAKFKYTYVPFIYVNNHAASSDEKLEKLVCAEFKQPPPECNSENR